MRKDKKKERKVKVRTMPLLVLEKVFSYLDWKDLGRAMLVCRRWSDVGGHPSLWTGFHLKLAHHKLPRFASSTSSSLYSFSNIRRLAWVKSSTIDLTPGKQLENCDDIVHYLTRMEEMHVLTNKSKALSPYEDFYPKCLGADNNKLVRIGFESRGGEEYQYFVTSCDAATTSFIKKTLIPVPVFFTPVVTIRGRPGVNLSYETLEAICSTTTYLYVATSFMIGQNIDIPKLTKLLKDNVFGMYWTMHADDYQKQDAGPINAILDLLASKNHGLLRILHLPKELLLKSHWAERLGRQKVEAYDDALGIPIVHTKYGLKILDEDEGEDDYDDEGEDDEEEEEEEEEDDHN